jgi:hypothetical protein
VGEERLRDRVPWYARHGFGGLVVVGRLREGECGPCTFAPGPLPAEAYRRRLKVIGALGELEACDTGLLTIRATNASPTTWWELEAGETRLLTVRATNASPTAWPALGLADGAPDQCRIGLAYRWLTPDGREVVSRDSNRTWLPHDVPPASSADVGVEVTTPDTPGSYDLEFDMVQEGVRWFTDPDYPKLRLRVTVVPPGGSTTPASAAPAFSH